MSTQGIREFRPHIHFTAPQGWINDPNGLVYENGQYHLFYQYYPHDNVWGPMHWGHAVSSDLISWKHLPIALFPDSLGYAFSGSAVYDTADTSGLARNGKTPIVLIYTAHRSGDELERQCLAFSNDGIVFTPYSKNPILSNPSCKDFRDPKVFWNPILDCWSMVVSGGTSVLFYASEDLFNWRQTGSFTPDDSSIAVCECPDLFHLEYHGGTIWVLIVSVQMKNSSPCVLYYTGAFDGTKFVTETNAERLDYGFDHYAAVTYQNTDNRILLGWQSNWQYAADLPTGRFCGCMTLPRELTLCCIEEKLLLGQSPAGLESYLSESRSIQNGDSFNGEVFLLTVDGVGACEIALVNQCGQRLRFGITSGNALYLNRSVAGMSGFNPSFEQKGFCEADRLQDCPYQIKLYFDVSTAELYVDHGTKCVSAIVFPDTPYCRIEFQGAVRVTHQSIQTDRL